MFKDFEFSDALRILQSTEEFPISFEDACLWSKIAETFAKNILLAEYEPNVDYLEVHCRTGKGGGPNKTFMLSTDCFKCLSVMSDADCSVSKNIRLQFKLASDKLSRETNRNQEINHNFVPTPLDPPTHLPQTRNITIKCELDSFKCEIIDLD